MEITLEEIQKKFESLPEDLKWAIMAANVDDNIIEISQTNGLNVEQMGQLSLETHMVMFGFTPLDKFEESIRNSLKLGDEKTRRRNFGCCPFSYITFNLLDNAEVLCKC